MPLDFYEKPLMYQGVSDKIIGPTEPIPLAEDEAFGIDIEAETVVITADVPQGVGVGEASAYVRLFGLLNDVSLRNIIPPEISPPLTISTEHADLAVHALDHALRTTPR